MTTTYALGGGNVKNGKREPYVVVECKSPDKGMWDTKKEAQQAADERNKKR